jgi:hypothetical protein
MQVNMRKLKITGILAAVFIISIMALAGCSSRSKKPFLDEEQTTVYPPKNEDDLTAKITLCRKISRKTGLPLGAGTVFKIKDKENLRAVVELKNAFTHNSRDLMFHFDWIKPDGKSLFFKPVALSPNDSTNTIISSISISPEVRQPGKYLLRLYYFRELIAEKHFELIEMADPNEDDVVATIAFCKKIDKASGQPVDVDSVFKIRKKGNVQLVAQLGNLPVDDDEELKFRVEWIDPEGNSFFRKKFELVPAGSTATFTSSISITPDKRTPGTYQAQLYLSNKLIAEKQFRLID